MDGSSFSFKRSIKFQGTVWAGHTVCSHWKARTLLPFSGPHHILCTSTHMLLPIYFVRSLDVCQISWWANSAHYLGKKIIQQKPKHKITPTQLSAGLASRRSSEKRSSQNQSWQTEKAELPAGWERKGGAKLPPFSSRAAEMYSAVCVTSPGVTPLAGCSSAIVSGWLQLAQLQCSLPIPFCPGANLTPQLSS